MIKTITATYKDGTTANWNGIADAVIDLGVDPSAIYMWRKRGQLPRNSPLASMTFDGVTVIVPGAANSGRFVGRPVKVTYDNGKPATTHADISHAAKDLGTSQPVLSSFLACRRKGITDITTTEENK